MKNCKELFRELIREITVNEPMEEIESLAYVLLQDCFGITRIQVLAGDPVNWSARENERLLTAIQRLNSGEPVQYITGLAPFFGRGFEVRPGVLIPRPETEELVLEVIRFISDINRHRPFRILDIGTGSGCIPVTLALELPDVSVMATDISDRALSIARQNVLEYKVAVQLLLHDILKYPIPFVELDVVVSNPPYVTNSEQHLMNRNVVEHEPPLALFVPDEDPLLFYRKISLKAREVLNPGGLLAFEINERYGSEVMILLAQHEYENVELLRDISGKPRIVKALMPK
jgi:release factor glutamine methyltransferase